ncbi:MAG: hypothetical protein CME36_09570 [unclassified Hahellaceae]|nr:hypothetical protein [Hahellaceae bacterium]|tara:strand:+ start:19091 stop:19285 length:195 start_codon:yes stop_codon:yes gene_type:complete
MSHDDPKARKEQRFRVNLDYYEADAVKALAKLHRKQAATYLAEIVRHHLESLNVEEPQMVRQSA